MEEEYPFYLKYFYQAVVIGMGTSLAGFRGNMEHYMKRINVIDWNTLDPDKEIKARKIDVEDRKKYFKRYFDLIDQVVMNTVQEYQQAMQMENEVYKSISEKKRIHSYKESKKESHKKRDNYLSSKYRSIRKCFKKKLLSM